MSLCMQKEKLTGFVLHIIQLVVIFVPFFIHKLRVVLYLLIVFYNLLNTILHFYWFVGLSLYFAVMV